MKTFAQLPERMQRNAPGRSGGPRSLAPQRGEQDRVRQVLRPGAGTALFKKDAPEGSGTKQKVEAEKPAAAQKTAGSCGAMASCPAEKCAEMKPAFDEAKAMVARAKDDLAPGGRGDPLPEKTRKALMWHFRTDSSEDVRQILAHFDKIESRLNQGLGILSCDDAGGHCHALGFIPVVEAYTWRGSHPIILCPPFFWGGTRSQATTIIHEAGHNAGLPRAPFEREVYIAEHEYRALSTEEALLTTDTYANFARDNKYGVPLRVAVPPGLPELRTGLALTGGEPSLALSYGYSFEFRHPALSIVNPVAGVEFTYIPALGESHERALASATIGARLGQRGQRLYFDLRAGAFIGKEDKSRRLAGVISEAAVHVQPGRFDISLFWRNYHTVFEGNVDTMVIGVGGAFKF